MLRNPIVYKIVSRFAHVLLFVPALWALIVSGATLFIIDGTGILLLIYLGRKLVLPVVEYFKLKRIGHGKA